MNFINKIKKHFELKRNHKKHIDFIVQNFSGIQEHMDKHGISVPDENISMTNLFLNNMNVAIQGAMKFIQIKDVSTTVDEKMSPMVRNNSFTNLGGGGNPVGGLTNNYANIGNTLGIMGSDQLSEPYYIYMTYWTTFYQTSSLANRLVGVLTEAMISKWICFDTKEKKKYKENLEKANDFVNKYHLKGMCTRAIRQMWMHGGSAIYIDTADANLREPLDKKLLKNSFKGFKFVDQGLLVPVDFQNTFNFGSDHFNQPEMWQIIFPNGQKSQAMHYSRFIFWIPEELPFDAKINQLWWGNSIFIPVHDDINNAERAFKSSGQQLQQASVRFLKTDMKNRTRVPGAAKNMSNKNLMFQKAITQNGNAILLDKEDEIEKLEVSNLNSVVEVLIALVNKICALKGIPITRFWGNPIAGLSSGDADLMQWFESVGFLQETYALRPMSELVDIINWIVFGKENEVTFKFNPVYESTESQKADVRLKKSQQRAIDFTNGVPLDIILKQISREGIYEDLEYKDCESYAEEFEKKQMDMEKANLAGMEPKDIKDGKETNKKPTNASKANQPENISQKSVHK